MKPGGVLKVQWIPTAVHPVSSGFTNIRAVNATKEVIAYVQM